MTARVVAFGELLLRLKAPGHERLLQSPVLEATFGGAESNVLAALASYGMETRYVTVLPPGPLGDAALGELRRFGIDTAFVRRAGARLGTYYLETGANQRAGRVVYDRAGSALAEAAPGDIDWSASLRGATWFHVSGITPAVSASDAALCLEAVRAARAAGIPVSCDLNYRHNLWQYGTPAPAVMREIVALVQLGIAGREDCRHALGIDTGPGGSGATDADAYQALAERVLDEFPSLERLAITLRESHGAGRNGWSAVLHNRRAFLRSRRYEIHQIVDRVGSGDAFTAGLLYGLLTGQDDAAALDFAAAAGCLKHAIPGDVNRATVAEIRDLLAGDESGRIRR